MKDSINYVGLVGIGRMGGGMIQRWRRHGITVTGYDRNPDVSDVPSLAALVNSMPAGERVVWLMLPEPAYDSTLDQLTDLLTTGDLILDGGNTNWHVTQQRHRRFAELDVHYVDVGTSGGIYGLEQGYALMVGATDQEFKALSPILMALAPNQDGLVHVGPSGMGHFAKEVHNGIEYGQMGALGEGFALLNAHPDVKDAAAVLASWRHGSIITSFLLDLAVEALEDPDTFATIAPVALASGEGGWTVQDAVDLGVPTPVIAGALYARLASQGGADDANRLVAALRHKFGGHKVVHATT